MSTHREQVEKAMLRYFGLMPTEQRRQVLDRLGVDYGAFMTLVRQAWEAEKDLPEADVLARRLGQIRAHVKGSRLGKTGRLFTLRHWPEARKLQKQGASYREIADYLREFRRFKISPAYLRRLMEQLAKVTQ